MTPPPIPPQVLIDDVARRHGFSTGAVQEAVAALQRSGGSQAQFGHPEFGGMGQWMPGMLMIGDMFNGQLKGRVDALFGEVSRRLAEFYVPPVQGTPAGEAARAAGGAPPAPQASFSYGYASPAQSWYPPELGAPAASGSQNNFRYAFFPAARRLAIELAGHVSVFDTDDHAIGGVSQQQEAGGGRITFTSQHGVVDLARLRRVS